MIPDIHKFVPSHLDTLAKKDHVQVDHSSHAVFTAEDPQGGNPVATYILPAAWCDRHPDAFHSILQSKQAIIIIGDAEIQRHGSATIVSGAYSRVLALASVSTEAAIDVGEDAIPADVSWTFWNKVYRVADGHERGNVKLLSTSAIMRDAMSNRGGFGE